VAITFRNNVYEVSLTGGTGNIVLEGTTGFYKRVRDRYALNERFPYGIEDDSMPAFEIGIGYLLTEDTLVREEVKDGTLGAGVWINFSSGPKRVFITDPDWVKNENYAKVSDRHYAHDQASPSSIWTVTHSLGKHPSISVVDSAGTLIMGEVEHLSLNQTRLTFSSAFAGKAYFN
jgi:hypothetical protein